MKKYQICTQCVMDTSDPRITFDDKGVCDHCRNYEKNIKPYWKPQENRLDELEELSKKFVKQARDMTMIVSLDSVEGRTVHIWHILQKKLCIYARLY